MTLRQTAVRFSLIFLCLAALPPLSADSGEAVRISGSTTVNPVVSEAAEFLRAAHELTIRIDTSGGSSGGINALGDGRADIAMSSRPLNDRDRKKFPNSDFRPVRIGEDAISIVVSKDVYSAGVRSIDKATMRDIYEGKIRNWQALGGEDRRIVFFNKEPGRGTWEMFVKWLYGSTDNTPRASHPEVGANAEVRSKVGRTPGALSFVSSAWVDRETIFPLSIQTSEGERIAGTDLSHENPLSRPLYVITDGTPQGAAATVIDYLLSTEGQALVRKHGYSELSNTQP